MEPYHDMYVGNGKDKSTVHCLGTPRYPEVSGTLLLNSGNLAFGAGRGIMEGSYCT